MSLFNHISRLFFIDRLIQRQATGTPEEFARKNRLSKSGLLKLIQDMKRLGYPIYFNRSKGHYCYKEQRKPELGAFKKLHIKLKKEERGNSLSRSQMREIFTNADKVDYDRLCYSETHFFEKC